MPAQRLPWFRFWTGATTHGKVRQLDDSTFRTWVELLDAAAQQSTRGRFSSVAEAASISRRPRKHVLALIAARLIDDTPEGLVMHDWTWWQRWRKDDANDTGTSPEDPRDQHMNGTRTSTPSPPESHVNDTGTYTRSPTLSTREERRESKEIERDLTPPSPPDGEMASSTDAPRLRVVGKPIPKPSRKDSPVGMLIDKIRALDPLVEVYGDHGFTGTKLKQNPDADLDLIAEAYVSFRHGEWPGSKMLRESGALAWVIGDVGGYAGWRAQRRGTQRLPTDRTGVAN